MEEADRDCNERECPQSETVTASTIPAHHVTRDIDRWRGPGGAGGLGVRGRGVGGGWGEHLVRPMIAVIAFS